MSTPLQATGTLHEKAGFSWPLAVGFFAIAIPNVFVLGTQTWTREEGPHGPLVLFTAAWLLWRQLPEIRQRSAPGKNWIIAVGLTVSLAMYIFGQAFDFITLNAAGLYGAGVIIFYALFGAGEIRRNW